MNNLLLSVILSLFIHCATAQRYNTAVGIKGDWSTLDVDFAQLSVKHYVGSSTGFRYDKPSAIEFNLGLSRRHIWLESMYLYNKPIKNNFDWYVGGGFDFGYWNYNYDNQYDKDLLTGIWGGVTAVFGLEYTFNFIPINLALDIGPTLRYFPEWAIGPKIGIATRYAFGAKK